MKKLLLLIAIISSLSPIFAANDISQLSAESQQEYLMNSLSIETSVETISSSFATASPLGNGAIASGIARGNSSTEWYPYLGPNQIDRGTFYQITDQMDLYEDYQNGINKEKNMHIAGWTMLGVGIVGFVISGLGVFVFEWGSFPAIMLELASLTVGACGIPLICWNYNDNVSISFAVGVSDIYNNRLYESLK